MRKKEDLAFFIQKVPALSKWYFAIPTYLAQLFIFILVMLFFCWIAELIWSGALIFQIIISSILSIHYIFLAKNNDKIRRKYLEKYKDFAGQKFWYRYQSWAIPLISAAFYFPLLLKTDYFLPSIIKLPSSIITYTLLPIFFAVPFSFLIIIVGIFLGKKSKEYNIGLDHYLDIIYPEKSNLICDGVYSIIRNPQYLSRGLISIGFGIFSNNILSIIVGFIHFISYILIIPAEDKYILSRFGKDFKEYKQKTPALFPKIKK